tara:strand:- start:136562 stop:137122 length:561 start_codon:yes stop_codon:yes gene_type:complete
MQFIFETVRLSVRKLALSDFESFHKMQSNYKVMQYVRAKPMTFDENQSELEKLVLSYELPDNDFWIYAIERKVDSAFVGTIALVKDDSHEKVYEKDEWTILNIKKDGCEIGYRFLEIFWGNGYGYEVVCGLVQHCRQLGFTQLIANVVKKNKASTRIIEKVGFVFVTDFVSDDLKLAECKFILQLR